LLDELVTPDVIQQLGNSGTMIRTWLEAILEFTILKHEVIVLRLQN